ncbi:MAG TPA: hypothetical protein VFQ45_19280 [Longimicrobium sp.]|nr:hypothetical protein [Longimicrobium sp.]
MNPHNTSRRGLGREGVALPMALMGLVVVTVLVTAALLSSSTELAISSAYRGATTNLYNADAALEQFLSNRGELAIKEKLADGSYDVDAPDGRDYTVAVARLNRTISDDGAKIKAEETYSLLVQPKAGGGRSVGALVEAVRSLTKLKTNIEAGAITGGGIDNSGNSEISAFSDLCEKTGKGVALYFTNDVTAQEKDKVDTTKIEGDTATFANVSDQQLIQYTLGGMSVDQLKELATIKFGFQGTAYSTYVSSLQYQENKHVNSFDYDVSSDYNWGCPKDVVTCDSAEDAAKFPVIAINAGGQTIGFQGDHGQGILYIFNGHLKVTGQFVFEGIVIVDGGRFEIAGTGTEGTKIEGSLIATGGVKDSRISGNAVVNYNICAIENAEAGFNATGVLQQAQVLEGSTFGWYEVVR